MENTVRRKTVIMVQCAVFLAMSVVVRIVEQSFPITMGGVQFMKLGLTAPFTLAPAILFGPAYGLVMGVLSDLMNLFSPNGGRWIPLLTLTAGLRGWLVGMIWLWIKKLEPKKVKLWIISTFSVIGLIGAINTLMVKLSPSTAYGQFILAVNEREKSIPNIFTYGLMISSVIMLLLIYLAAKIENSSSIYSKRQLKNNFFLLLVAVTIPSIVQTTLNTFVLRSIIAQHANIAFIIYYIPRIAKTLIVGMVTTFIINDIILYLYEKMYPNY